jgi:hypothetical protein
MPLTITVNGSPYVVSADSAISLLYILRNDLGLNDPKFGCGVGQCGACKVLIGDQAIASCSIALGGIGDQPVTTLEGLGTVESPWLRINPDGTVDVFTGKVEVGQGTITARAQITAEKLDVEFERIRMRPTDTAHCPYAKAHQNS